MRTIDWVDGAVEIIDQTALPRETRMLRLSTVEELVDAEVVRADPNRTLIPGIKVDAVVVCPRGAHPSYAQGYYDRDNRFYLEWDRISRDPETLEVWLDEWVYGTATHEEYVEKLGAERWAELTPAPALSGSVDYGDYR